MPRQKCEDGVLGEYREKCGGGNNFRAVMFFFNDAFQDDGGLLALLERERAGQVG